MAVTLRQLEIFLAAAEEEHFGRAARRLYLSQPAVSKEVRALEHSLRTDLFLRSPRGVTLTPNGAQAARLAFDIMERVRRLERSMTPEAVEGAGQRTVTVAASPSIVDGFLPAAVSRAEKGLPEILLRSRDVETGQVGRAVAAGEADLGLGHFVATEGGLHRESIRRDPIVGVVRRDRAAGAGVLSAQMLGNLPLLIWPRQTNPAYYDFLLALCRSMGFSPDILTAPPRVMGLRSYYLTEGRAFALFPEATGPRLSPGLVALPLERAADIPLDMVWRDDEPASPLPAVRAFLHDVARHV